MTTEIATDPIDTSTANVSITNPCKCIPNHGICQKKGPELYCLCFKGFEGNRCQETEIFISFSSGKESTETFNSSFAIAIAFACLAVIVIAITGFLVWRRTSRIREKRRWIKWQESRRQSKATIEGNTIVETLSKQGQTNSCFQSDILKEANCKNLFVIHADLNNKDLEKQERNNDPEWAEVIKVDRHSELPIIHNCLNKDSHLSLVVNKNHLSFLSYSPTGLAKGTLTTLPSKNNASLKVENETNKEKRSMEIKLDSSDNVTGKDSHPIEIQKVLLSELPLNAINLQNLLSCENETKKESEKHNSIDNQKQSNPEKDQNC